MQSSLKKLILSLIIFFIAQIIIPPLLSADEIYLKNGDRITGKLIKETKKDITVKSPALGDVTIEQKFIQRVQRADPSQGSVVQEAPSEQKPKLWKNEFSFGYSQAGGNTESIASTTALKMNRKTDWDEWTVKARGYYGSSNGEMNDRKFSGLVRYAYSFGNNKKWYNFNKMEGNRDRFADIEYRLIPSVGVGYWFSDKKNFKAMAEAAIGFEHTNFRGEAKSTNEAIFIPRGFLQKKLWGELVFSQDIFLYPSLSDFGEYRFSSQTDFTNPIDEKLSLKISFIDKFDSNPPKDTEKNDFRIISSLVYSF